MWEGFRELFFYQRPQRVRPTSLKSRGSVSSRSTISIPGIPDKLSFGKVINGETCFPCRLEDFMNYLIYVERNSENLRFYLWFKSYVRKFESLSELEKRRSASWEACPILRDKEKDEESPESNPDANVATQPFRTEINRVIQTFLLSSSPLELNLSGRDRSEVLMALSNTTHPSAFASVLPQVEGSLRQQSHPNFIRYALSTTNTGRITAMRVGGVILVISAIILAVALSLGRVHKAIRIICPCILMFFGICSILDGQRSVCLVLLTFGVRDRFPWEKEEDCLVLSGDGIDGSINGDIEKSSMSSHSFDLATAWDGPIPKDEDREGRIEKHEKMSMVSHVLFGWARLRGIDPEVERLQRVMVLQNAGVATLFTALTVAILAGVPGGTMY